MRSSIRRSSAGKYVSGRPFLWCSLDVADLISVGHGISITDNWWIQSTEESLDYRALKQYNEGIADIALFGASNSQSSDISGYRELGTVGSFEKVWRFINGA